MQYNARSLHSDSDANTPSFKPHQNLVANSFRPQRISTRSHVAIDSSLQDVHAQKVASSPTSSPLTSSAWSPAESATQASFPALFNGFWASNNASGDSQFVAGRNIWPSKIDHMINPYDIIPDDDWYDHRCLKMIQY
jgi:hypothetical protein